MPSEYTLLARAPVTVTIAGTRVRLPYRPAAEWVAAVEDLSRLAGTLADDEGRSAIVDLVLEHASAVTELRRESYRILAEATGRKWWEAGRLISTSVGTEVLGRMVLAGVDPWSRSVGEWVAAVYALCTKGQDEKGRLRFDFMLSLPPPDYEDEWDDGDDDPGAAADWVSSLNSKR